MKISQLIRTALRRQMYGLI